MIDKVRAALERQGWIKDDFENDHGLCILGAIGLVVYNDTGRYSAISEGPELALVAKVIREQYMDRVCVNVGTPAASAGWICGFNDASDTVLAEVFAVLEKAAAEEGA